MSRSRSNRKRISVPEMVAKRIDKLAKELGVSRPRAFAIREKMLLGEFKAKKVQPRKYRKKPKKNVFQIIMDNI